MSDLPADFDLKLVPDWLKETPAKNPYADYEVREKDRPGRDFSRGGDRNERGGPPRGNRPRPAGGKGRDDKRGRDSRDKGDRRTGGPQRRDNRPSPESAAPAAPPANVSVEFLPQPNFVTSLARQIHASNRAWPLFGLARLFLEKPERHRVRVTSGDAAAPLWQIGEDGPVTLDRAVAERVAFGTLKNTFYVQETTQQEPPKGNFSNVARCKLTGSLLGPTNHHGYQPALRRLYEERFSRRMSFQDFVREIEIVSDPAAVEAWKDQARSVTVFKTAGEGEPLVFQSAAEAEQHFRSNHLEAALRSGPAFELSGEASRSLPDRRISQAVKNAWEQQRGFPGSLMHHLRRDFGSLHFFKHRKRMQFISAIRPAPLKAAGLSPGIAAILRAIDAAPGCTRAALVPAVLGENPTDAAKAALAGDLHWLTHAGHVIEFHDGRLDLPLVKPETVEPASVERREPAISQGSPAPASSPIPQEQ